MAAIKEDWRRASLDAEFKAAFGLLEKLTLEPQNVTAADVQPLRDAGLDDKAIYDVIQVGVIFTLATRTADVFDLEVPDAKEQEAHVKFLAKSAPIRRYFMG